MFKYFLLLGVLVSSTLACSPISGNSNNVENGSVESIPEETIANNNSTQENADDAISNTDFREIDVQTFQERYNLTTITPRAVGMDLFERFTQESEGRQAESLSIEYPTGETATTTVTIVGLADDSVNAERFQIEFERNEQGWDMVFVGSQFRCQPGRGQQDWGLDLCS